MSWLGCKNILCIRPDNMGDLIMTGPAIRALKESFDARITILTSSMAKGITTFMPEIDDVLVFDTPWVKTTEATGPDTFADIIPIIRRQKFDAAVVFNVYSQNPLPNAMLAYLAGIPKILAYCRENPYHLITDWVPDTEPYDTIKHQVRRDLDLVATVGAIPQSEGLSLQIDESTSPHIEQELQSLGVDSDKPWLLMHAGVSELKREFPVRHWAAAGKKLVERGYQVILTGSAAEKQLTDELAIRIGQGSFSAGGMFALDEFICLVKNAPLLLAVNTGTIHIAAAVGTPVVVLYAQSNPQHTPWGVPNKVLEFPIPAHLRSRNEVIRYVNKTLYSKPAGLPTVDDILNAVDELINLPVMPAQQFPERPFQSREIAAS